MPVITWTCGACHAVVPATTAGGVVQFNHVCSASASTFGTFSVNSPLAGASPTTAYTYSQFVATLSADLPPNPPTLPQRKLVGVDYVMGFRTWTLGIADGKAMLFGHNGSPWDGRPAQHYPSGDCLSPRCTQEFMGPGCGYYAYSRPDDWQKDFGFQPPGQYKGTLGSFNVHGICKMWGTIVRHGDGYRAQYAAPVALLRSGAFPHRVLQSVADELGIVLINAEDRLAVAREHGYVWGDPLPEQTCGLDDSPSAS